MRRTIERFVQKQQIVEIIYIDQFNQLTKRRIKLLKLKDKIVLAYCFTRRSLRSFKVENILAITPKEKSHLMAY